MKKTSVETRGLYAGSFDPPTNGHRAVIEAGAELFDQLEVAIGVNAAKSSMFDIHERTEMLEAITDDLPNVSISSYEGLFLVDYATQKNFTHILRGLRTSNDFDDERPLFVFNRDHNPQIQTIFYPSPPELDTVSSSFVKGLRGCRGWEEAAAQYVNPFVLEALKRTIKQK